MEREESTLGAFKITPGIWSIVRLIEDPASEFPLRMAPEKGGDLKGISKDVSSSVALWINPNTRILGVKGKLGQCMQ